MTSHKLKALSIGLF